MDRFRLEFLAASSFAKGASANERVCLYHGGRPRTVPLLLSMDQNGHTILSRQQEALHTSVCGFFFIYIDYQSSVVILTEGNPFTLGCTVSYFNSRTWYRASKSSFPSLSSWWNCSEHSRVDCAHCMRGDWIRVSGSVSLPMNTNSTPYLYPLIGSWGTLVFPKPWEKFLHWYHERKVHVGRSPAL